MKNRLIIIISSVLLLVILLALGINFLKLRNIGFVNISPKFISWKFNRDGIFSFKLLNNESVESIRGIIFTPNLWHYKNIRKDDEIEISHNMDGTYHLKAKDTLPSGNTVITLIIFKLKDNKKVFYLYLTSTAKDYFELFLSIPAYIIAFIFWIIGMFALFQKRNKWIFVYDSYTKKGVFGAILRVYDKKSNNLITTAVSDVYGVVKLSLNKGVYTITVNLPNYKFPSNLFPLKNYGRFTDLYYGEEIKVNEKNKVIKLNIPIDSNNSNFNVNIIDQILDFFLANITIFYWIFTIGFSLMFFFIFKRTDLYKSFEFYTFLIIGTLIHIFKFMVKHKDYGIVKDINGKILKNTALTLYDSEFDFVVDKTETDDLGRYRFVVQQGKYYIKFDDPNIKLVNTNNENAYYFDLKKRANFILNKDLIVKKENETNLS